MLKSEEGTRSVSPKSWILISADEMSMQLTRRHSDKDEDGI